MLLIMPGAGQAPDSYLPLAKHLSSQASNGSLDLWVAVAGVDTMAASQVLAALDALNTKQPLQAFAGLGAPYSGGVPSSEQLMLQLLQEVVGVCNERSGQVLQRSNTGRYTNLVVAPHSMASMLFADAALMIAGTRYRLSTANCPQCACVQVALHVFCAATLSALSLCALSLYCLHSSSFILRHCLPLLGLARVPVCVCRRHHCSWVRVGAAIHHQLGVGSL